MHEIIIMLTIPLGWLSLKQFAKILKAKQPDNNDDREKIQNI